MGGWVGKWNLEKKEDKQSYDSKQSPEEGRSGSVPHGNSGDTLQLLLLGARELEDGTPMFVSHLLKGWPSGDINSQTFYQELQVQAVGSESTRRASTQANQSRLPSGYGHSTSSICCSHPFSPPFPTVCAEQFPQ